MLRRLHEAARPRLSRLRGCGVFAKIAPWLCHSYLVKTAVFTYAVLLGVTGLVTLSVLGASLVQQKDPRGIAVLALVVGGLLLAFAYALISGRKSRAVPNKGNKSPASRIYSSSASAEYPHSASLVWALIRPAEAAVTLSSDVDHAFAVPAMPGGPGERQCFFLRNGQISIIEVLSEIPERLAVTRSLLPPSEASMKMTYRLDPTPAGCRLTIETLIEAPDNLTIDQQGIQKSGSEFVGKVAAVLAGTPKDG